MDKSENSIIKIYASSTDKIGSRLLYEFIVNNAKERGISGVTVYRGVMGYGLSSNKISSSKYWELTEKLPVMIEIIDKTAVLEEYYDMLIPELKKVPKGILVTLEPVTILFQKTGNSSK